MVDNYILTIAIVSLGIAFVELAIAFNRCFASKKVSHIYRAMPVPLGFAAVVYVAHNHIHQQVLVVVLSHYQRSRVAHGDHKD